MKIEKLDNKEYKLFINDRKIVLNQKQARYFQVCLKKKNVNKESIGVINLTPTTKITISNIKDSNISTIELQESLKHSIEVISNFNRINFIEKLQIILK